VQEDHTVVVTFRVISYSVNASVSGGNGSVSPATQSVNEGNNASITITPNSGYEIDTITDNGISRPINNPYVTNNVQEDHTVVVTFRHIIYPPTLTLTGERKTERAWIIKRDYSVLTILIEEHPTYPKEVSKFILYKRENGEWKELKSYTSSGIYTYLDKFLDTGASVLYRLTAFASDGSIVIETTLGL
jgi:hypothetical protein